MTYDVRMLCGERVVLWRGVRWRRDEDAVGEEEEGGDEEEVEGVAEGHGGGGVGEDAVARAHLSPARQNGVRRWPRGVLFLFSSVFPSLTIPFDRRVPFDRLHPTCPPALPSPTLGFPRPTPC